MLQKLYKLGVMVPESMFVRDPLDLSQSYAGKYILFLEFNDQSGAWRFEGVDSEDFQASRIRQYLFKTKGGNAVSEFPTIDVYNPDFLRVNGQVDLAHSKSGRKLIRILGAYGKLFAGIREQLQSNPAIAEALANKIGDRPRFALSLKLNGAYLGDAPQMQPKIQAMTESGFDPDYFTYKNQTFEGEGQTCSLSGKTAEKLWGYVSPYKFYAVKTEASAIPGGFDPKQAWRNFPVAPETAKILERGDKFLQEKLSFKLCGYPYFLIPEMVGAGEPDAFLDFVQDFRKFSLGQAGKDQVNAEIDLLDALKDQDNTANYNLFFYEKNNAEFKILASIDEVFPSRVRQIWRVKREVEAHSVFHGLPGKNKTLYDQKFDLAILKTFFPNNKKEGNFRHSFLGVLRAIFMGEPLDAAFVMRRVMDVIRRRFANNKTTLGPTIQAILLIKVLKGLELWRDLPNRYKKDDYVMENQYEDFFAEHADIFDAPVKNFVFLEGVLCQFLLNIQFQEKNATPFRSRLNGLRLDDKIVKQLLPEMIGKLEQYKKNYYRNLEHTIFHYFLRAKFNLSRDEYGLFFAMGMSLARDFKKEEQPPEGENQP